MSSAYITLKGRYKFFQDFSTVIIDFKRAKKFEVVDEVNGLLRLRAKNFGILGKKNQYGNGCLYLSPKNIKGIQDER